MKKILLLYFFTSFAISCSNDSGIASIVQQRQTTNNDYEDYSQYFSNSTITTQIKFLPEEIYLNHNVVQPPTLHLKFITTEQYPCINYSLITSQFINGNSLIIRFEGITDPGICLTAIGPATKQINLPLNIDRLILLNGTTIDKYDINITNEKISVNLIQSSFTESLYQNTFRYPENSFAFVCGTNTNNTQIRNDFLDVLLTNNTLTEIFFQGQGRIPYPTSSSGNWVNQPSRYFRYNNQSDFDALGPVLTNFKNQNIVLNSGVTINLYGWNNKNHY